jgi:hypothetical protein
MLDATAGQMTARFNTKILPRCFIFGPNPRTSLGVDLSASRSASSSVTDRGCVRTWLDLELRRVVIRDLFLDLSLYGIHNNGRESNSEATSGHDIVTAMGNFY